MFLNFIVYKGSVKEKDGYTKVSGLKLIPFDDRPTDVIATYEEIRFRKPADRTFAG
jgi:hypothetical protein